MTNAVYDAKAIWSKVNFDEYFNAYMQKQSDELNIPAINPKYKKDYKQIHLKLLHVCMRYQDTMENMEDPKPGECRMKEGMLQGLAEQGKQTLFCLKKIESFPDFFVAVNPIEVMSDNQ